MNDIYKLIDQHYFIQRWYSGSEIRVYSGQRVDGGIIGNLKFLTCQELLHLSKLLMLQLVKIIIHI